MVNFVLWHCSSSITVIVLYQYFTKTITVIGESQCHNRHLGITTNIDPHEGSDWSTIAPLKCNDVYTRVTVAANNYDCPQPDPGATAWSSRTTLGRAGKNRPSIIICRYRAIVPSGAVHQQTWSRRFIMRLLVLGAALAAVVISAEAAGDNVWGGNKNL